MQDKPISTSSIVALAHADVSMHQKDHRERRIAAYYIRSKPESSPKNVGRASVYAVGITVPDQTI